MQKIKLVAVIAFLVIALVPSAVEAQAPKPFGDGSYGVGKAIQPGVYRSNGKGSYCYWEILDAAGGIIENHFGLAGGAVTIGGNAATFKSRSCGAWSPLNPAALPALSAAQQLAPKKDGFYIVGLDIAPGLWKSDGKRTGCYWSRTSLGMEILDNDFGYGGGTVMLRAGDFEFYTRGCGTWTPLDSSNLPALPAAQQDATRTDGNYIVGLNMSAGLWQSTAASTRCYWEKQNTQQDLAANYLGVSPTTVTLNPGEFEFQSSNCGTWVKIKTGAAPVISSQSPGAPQAPSAPAKAPTGAACPAGNVCITSPASGLVVQHGAKIVFTGSANAPRFVRYQFQAKAVGSDGWGHVADFTKPVSNGQLMEFVTASIPPGSYIFRLQVIDNTGNALAQKAEVALTIR